MDKKWFQDWHSWLTIILLVFVPTFLFGLIFMWCCAPWSKKTKWWITGIGLGIPLMAILIPLLLVSASPKKQLLETADLSRRAAIQEITSSAHRYCVDKNRCPSNLAELKQDGYIKEMPLDPETNEEYTYHLLDMGKECMVEAVLGTGETFTLYCFKQVAP